MRHLTKERLHAALLGSFASRWKQCSCASKALVPRLKSWGGRHAAMRVHKLGSALHKIQSGLSACLSVSFLVCSAPSCCVAWASCVSNASRSVKAAVRSCFKPCVRTPAVEGMQRQATEVQGIASCPPATAAAPRLSLIPGVPEGRACLRCWLDRFSLCFSPAGACRGFEGAPVLLLGHLQHTECGVVSIGRTCSPPCPLFWRGTCGL